MNTSMNIQFTDNEMKETTKIIKSIRINQEK